MRIKVEVFYFSVEGLVDVTDKIEVVYSVIVSQLFYYSSSYSLGIYIIS